MTRLGSDAFGDMVSTRPQDSGVRVEAGSVRDAATSLAVATLAAGSATYDFRIEWNVPDLDPFRPGPADSRG